MPKALDGSTITGPCTGGCGAVITYTITLEHGTPEISPPFGAIQYKGGHLCPVCDRIVTAALTRKPDEAVAAIVLAEIGVRA